MLNEVHAPVGAVRNVHGTDYVHDILARLPVPIVTVAEGLSSRMQGMSHAQLRHDVDFYLDNAFAMAQLEHMLGISSTYFMLPPDGITNQENYFGRISGGRLVISGRFLDAARAMQDMGHEIGLHNDLISFWIGTGMPPRDALDFLLNELRKAGLRIRGTVGHGSPLCYRHGFLNRDIFSGIEPRCKEECLRVDGRELPLCSINMRDLDLEYEASVTPRDLYVTDSRNRLCVARNGETVFPGNDELKNGMFAGMLAGYDGLTVIQLLLHPDHWAFTFAIGGRNVQPGVAALKGAFLESRLATKMDVLGRFPNVAHAEVGDLQASYNISYLRDTFHFPDQRNWTPFPVAAMRDADTEPHILELGCGQGDFLPMVAGALPDAPGRVCVGVDASCVGIADAAARYPCCRWVADRGEHFLDSMMQGGHEAMRLPARYGLILDKTGLTAVDGLDEAYAVLKKISRLLAPGGRYVYLALAEFYERRYGDGKRWPMSWVEIAARVFTSAERLSEHPAMLAFSFGMD